MRNTERLKIALSCAAVTTALSAQAETGFRFQPYAGLAYQYISGEYKNLNDFRLKNKDLIENNFNGGLVYLGARLSDHFGVEIGYSRTQESKKSLDPDMSEQGTRVLVSQSWTLSEWSQGNLMIDRSGVQMQTYSFDLLGYYPLDTKSKLELIGSAGLINDRLKATFYGKLNNRSYSIVRKRREKTLRLGLGTQYEVSNNFRVRLMTYYNSGDFEGIVDNFYTASLGFNYSF